MLLEITAPTENSLLAAGALDGLLHALRDQRATIVGNDDRYSLELRISALTEAEALFIATARWRDASQRQGLPEWRLARSEVLTVEEFEQERDDTDILPPVSSGVSFDILGDDLLPRALQDSLTGLVNRELFADRVRSALADEGPEATKWAVLVFDVDNFGSFNQTEGPAVGDRLLAVLASRISRIPEHIMVARLGGDEFAVLARRSAPGDVEKVASRLLDAIRAPVELAGRKVSVTASLGSATSANMSHPDDLIRDAAIAMCIAKADGGDCFRRFDAGVSVDVRRLDFDADPAPDRLAHVLLLERSALAANECQELEDAAAIVLGEVCAHTGWRVGHLRLVANTGEWVEATPIWHTRGPDYFKAFRKACDALSLGIGQGLAGRVLETGSPSSTIDVATSTRFPPSIAAAAASSGIRSGFAFPILVGNEVVAVLEFYSSGTGRLNDALSEVMAGVCSQLARVAERSRARDALARTEEKYRIFADSAPMLMWMCDVDGQCTLLNSAWVEFTGRPLEEELGEGWMAGIHPDDLARVLESFALSAEKRAPFEIDFRLRRADGEYRTMVDRGNPIGIGDFFQGFVGGCIDDTDRRRAEAAVRDSETRLQAMLATAGSIITLLDADGAVLADYQGTTEGLGYPAGSSTGRLGMEFVHPDDLPRIADAFAQVVAKPGLADPVHLRVQHADGTWRWVEAIANNLLEYPPVQAIVISAVDISKRMAAEDALAHSEERFRMADDVGPIGLWHWDLVSGERAWSDEVFQIVGRTRSETGILTDVLGEVVLPADRVELNKVRSSYHDGQPISRFQVRIRRGDGEIRRLRFRGMVLRDDAGKPIAASGTMRDVTDFFINVSEIGDSGAA